MDKETLQLWERYKQYVEEISRPYREKSQQLEEARFQMQKLEEENLWKEVDELKKELEDYKKLPWYRKLFRLAPESDYMLPFRDSYLNRPLFFHKDIEPTWEGFLNWQLEQNTEKQADTMSKDMPI